MVNQPDRKQNLRAARTRTEAALKLADLEPNLSATLSHFLGVFANLPEQSFDAEWPLEKHLTATLHVVARGLEYYAQTRSESEPKLGNTIQFPSGRRVEVYPTDAPRFLTWAAAVDWCATLGEGWRLPTREELDTLHVVANQGLDDFTDGFYWSSEEPKPNSKSAYGVYLSDGDVATSAKTAEECVRAVRTVQDNEPCSPC